MANIDTMRIDGPVYDDLSERLFAELPHLRPLADAKFGFFGDDEVGAYLVYEDVLNPHLAALLGLAPSDERDGELRRIFALIEDLAQEQSVEPGWGRQAEAWLRTRSRELVRVAVIEFLEEQPDCWIPQSRTFMGPRTRHLLDDAIAERERLRATLKARPWLGDVEREMLERLDDWFARFERGR